MNSSVSLKIEDFANWAKIAFEHYQAARYSDALTNIRKAGEACCKLLILKKDSRNGEELIKNKSYKELINVAININAAPRRVINWLETFQIFGNLATHDVKVDGIQAEYGYNALKLLTEWLFVDELETNVPPRLLKYIRTKHTEDELKKQVEKLNNELNTAKKQSKKLGEELDEKKASVAITTDSDKDLKKELEDALEKVKQMEAMNERIRLLEEQLNITLNEAKQEIKKPDNNEAVNEKLLEEDLLIKKERTKRLRKKIIIVFVLAAVAIISGIILYPKNKNKTIASGATELKNDSTINILILPLAVMQENPNIHFKIEEAIANEIKKQSEEKHLQVNVIYDPVKDKPAISINEALKKGKAYNCEIVYYGELYERATADSVDISLKYVFMKPEDFGQMEINGESEIKVFSKLTDKNFNILKGEIASQITLTYANKLLRKNKYDEVISMLEREKYTTKKMRFDAWTFKKECYLSKGEIKKAKNEVETMYKLFPDSAFAKFELAFIYSLDSIKEYKKSKILYEEALKQYPDNAYYLSCYANLLARSFNDTATARKLLLKAVSVQPDYFIGWQYLGNLMQTYYKDNKIALVYYKKSLQLSPVNLLTLNYITGLYYSTADYINTISYSNKMLSIDSTELSAINLKLQAYFHMKNYDSALYYGLKSARLTELNVNKNTKALNYASLGNLLFDAGKPEYAKILFNKALSLDSNQFQVYGHLGDIYIHGDKNIDKAYQLARRDLRNNSENSISCFNMGYFLSVVSKGTKFYNFDEGIRLLKKSYLLNPNLTDAADLLGQYYQSINDLQTALKYFSEEIKMQPANYNYNYNIGTVYRDMNDPKMARYYFETCVKINDYNISACQELANSYIRQPGRDLQKAEYYAKKTIDINKNSAMGYFRLADVYIAENNLNDAWQNYQKAISLDSSARNADFDKVFKTVGFIH